ncbi:MAG: glycosyltransferase family 2 protein [Spirochaetes bacterium]|nr:glycosyltransferase family 2 protein [Spirochaetota bacterium]
MPKSSFIMITARSDYPYLGRPNLHLFEPTLESFKYQTIKDFEWIIVDGLYEKRKDYFKDLELPFGVKHVPLQPNIWYDRGFPGISTQYNKGIIHADGELLFFTGDSHMMQPHFMEHLWKNYQEGFFSLAWYCFDNSFAVPAQDLAPGEKKQFNIAYPNQKAEAPVKYDMLGYSGKVVSVEHRYIETFQKSGHDKYSVPWQWWFGCSSASLESMLKINGFDQNFDGDRMLLDCDVGSRLEMAGYAPRFAFFKDVFLIRCATDINKWNQKIQKDRITIKCNYGLMWHSRFFNNYRANTSRLSDYDIDWIKGVFCKQHCPIRELCAREHKWQFPFEHKSGYAGHRSSKRWFNFWKEHQGFIDLEEERELRFDGKKYTEGTFVGES